MKPKTIELAGLVGIGRTKGIAKQDLERQIERALKHDYWPRLLEYRGHRCLIWRTPTGIISHYGETGKTESLGRIPGSFTSHHPDTDIACIVRSASMHLAQLASDVDSDDIPDIIAAWPSAIDEYDRWLGFQRAFKHIKATNPEMPDNVVHFTACNKAHEFKPKR